eukprot:GHUV01036496.1.p1 GENE.GHUV01036496.1~~GHUV01036496.1.p1  ORF type:complete len:155 (+),score=4.25 GHUV01036496.1:76-540(+)
MLGDADPIIYVSGLHQIIGLFVHACTPNNRCPSVLLILYSVCMSCLVFVDSNDMKAKSSPKYYLLECFDIRTLQGRWHTRHACSPAGDFTLATYARAIKVVCDAVATSLASAGVARAICSICCTTILGLVLLQRPHQPAGVPGHPQPPATVGPV